jgi:hypothetical protein
MSVFDRVSDLDIIDENDIDRDGFGPNIDVIVETLLERGFNVYAINP